MARWSRVAIATVVIGALGAVGSAGAAPSAGAPPHATTRAPWTGSRITGTPDPLPPFIVQPAFPKLKFTRPVELVPAPDGDRLFLVELGGKIYSFPNRRDADKADLFVDLAGRPGGVNSVFGLAFHPRFAKNRFAYLAYLAKDGSPQGSHLSRFRVTTDNPPRLDLASETLLLDWYGGGHNGGSVKFGADGYLYLSTGDGAAPFPPDSRNVGQTVDDLMAAIIRIDVDHEAGGKPYAIPPDNPFLNTAGARPELWAYGFRNPWRMSIDPRTNDLWVGDVGWETWELVFHVQRGGNYGWSVMEGPQKVRADIKPGPTPILPPVVVHPHSEARSITGGHVYRGRALPGLQGAYIYGDYETGKIWGLRDNAKTGKVTWHKELADSRLNVVAFGLDQAGELVLVDHGAATNYRPIGQRDSLFRLVPNPAARANTAFPRRLGETGLFRSARAQVLAPGVVEYTVNAEPWADGAVARRFIALPGRTTVEVQGQGQGQGQLGDRTWKFPTGTVLGKTLSLPAGDPADGTRAIETQLLHFDGHDWRGYSYRWADDQSDAVLVGASGEDASINSATDGAARRTWHIPGRAECGTCHHSRAGTLLGFVPAQLQGGGDGGRQLADLADAGVLATAPAAPVPAARLVNPYDETADLTARARSYLHANCAHCHSAEGGGMTAVMLSHDLPLAETHTLTGTPTQGTFGIPNASVITPGDPFRSVLFYRLATVGSGRMPRLGSRAVDDRALSLFQEWIATLPSPTATTKAPLPANTDVVDVDRLLQSTSGALRLARALDAGTVPSNLRTLAVAKGVAHEHPEVRGLFERYVPEDRRLPRLGENLDPRPVLALAGKPDHGREIFFASGSACSSCHRIGGKGGTLGPDLSHIGTKYKHDKILESVLEPSKAIDATYLWYVIETKDGQTIAGKMVDQNDQSVALVDASGVPVRVPTANVKQLVAQEKSPMPELLLAAMTAQEAADLIAFLASLK